MKSLDEEGFRRLTRKLGERPGVAIDAYKDKCLRRRIAVRMRACGAHTYADYLGVLERVPEEYERLMDTLTINVTKFFRNPETWERLGGAPVLELLKRTQGELRLWSAGCASGEEAYTLAIVVAEAAAQMGRGQWLGRMTIDATDVDRACLERAKSASYPPSAFSEAPAALIEKYCEPVGAELRVVESLRSRVRVSRRDLNRAPAPLGFYDMIVCRNVVIYFDRATQEQLFSRFAEALRGDGLLVLGKVETLVGPARDLFGVVDARERIYRRRG